MTEDRRATPFVHTGALALLMGGREDMDRLPLAVLLTVACQAGHLSRPVGSLALNGQFVNAARRLGLQAELIAARVVAERSDSPRRSVCVGTSPRKERASIRDSEQHAAIWMPKFGIMTDVGIFADDRVHALVDDLDCTITTPVAMEIDIYRLQRINVTPAVRRGPLLMSWQLDPGAGEVLDTVLQQHSKVIEGGGQHLTDVALELIIAMEVHIPIDEAFKECPRLRTLLEQRRALMRARAGQS